jgi:hypothetical protein
MSGLEAKTFDFPDEVRQFEANGQVALVNLSRPGREGHVRPGWKWSNDVKPIAGTDRLLSSPARAR